MNNENVEMINSPLHTSPTNCKNSNILIFQKKKKEKLIIYLIKKMNQISIVIIRLL